MQNGVYFRLEFDGGVRLGKRVGRGHGLEFIFLPIKNKLFCKGYWMCTLELTNTDLASVLEAFLGLKPVGISGCDSDGKERNEYNSTSD